MQQLMDTTPLPTLLMRTVIQSLAMYPKLIGFVMNIMQRLIIKQARVTMFCSVLFCSLAVLDPRVGHTMDVLSPFISVLCHSD